MIKYHAVSLFETGKSTCDFSNSYITNNSDSSIIEKTIFKIASTCILSL